MFDVTRDDFEYCFNFPSDFFQFVKTMSFVHVFISDDNLCTGSVENVLHTILAVDSFYV